MKFQLGHRESADHSRSRADDCCASRAISTLRVPPHHHHDIQQRLGSLRAALDELAVIGGRLDAANKERYDAGAG
jgi:hypothetical protein